MSKSQAPQSIAERRDEYLVGGLSDADAGNDPLALFDRWFAEAIDVCRRASYEANVMTLATVGPDGTPSARIVLLKGFDEDGFVFFSNYRSRKGRELHHHPVATLVFHWLELERQVRVTGPVAKTSRGESEQYFASRPRGSQLGAWVSRQSEPTTRQEMEQRLEELDARYAGQPIPCPPHWGGYRLKPHELEFWQGRENRLHDRILFQLEDNGTWHRTRLSP